jgi:hypothetical protein
MIETDLYQRWKLPSSSPLFSNVVQRYEKVYMNVSKSVILGFSLFRPNNHFIDLAGG